MRFDMPIFFQSVIQGEYDPGSGNYGPDKIVETKKYASVTDSGTETMKLIYGELKQGSKIVRLQNSYEAPFDRIQIGRRIYRVDFSRMSKRFVVSEVQK